MMALEAATVHPIGSPSRADPALAELVEAARGGDRRAFAELHRRYSRMVHAILLARVPRSAADDLVQDVFVVALERLDGLRDGAAFGAWLAQIARRRAVDHLRAGRSADELPDDLAAPGEGAPAAAEAARALAALRALPEAYRETLLMRLVEGMTGPEIAERTGLQPASVRVNLHRGMRLLRERLGLAARDDEAESDDG